MVETKKECKRCHDKKPLKEFPRSAFAKDGHLGYCGECWSKVTTKSATKRKKHKPAKKRPLLSDEVKAKVRKAVADKSIQRKVEVANKALRDANALKEQFLVRTDGDKPLVLTFKDEQKALRQAMDWKMKGRTVTVWRQCAFEMVLRIIG